MNRHDLFVILAVIVAVILWACGERYAATGLVLGLALGRLLR